MIVLVVGEHGQLAQSLSELSAEEVRIVTMGRPLLDLLQPDSIVRALEAITPDIVVNAAAYTAVDKSETEPGMAFAVNANGPGLLALEFAKRGTPLIHVSTDYVYDGAKPTAYVEDDPVNPINVYGRSKLAGEQRVAAANPRHLILRTAWVHSPFGNNFVKTMLRLASTRPEIGVVDDQLGSPTYAPHLARSIVEIITQIAEADAEDARWGIYNATNSGETSWFGLAHEVFKDTFSDGRAAPQLNPITSAQYPTPATRPANSRLDTTKLGRTFGIKLPPWALGVAECVQRITNSS